jgi:hypothetical protein
MGHVTPSCGGDYRASHTASNTHTTHRTPHTAYRTHRTQHTPHTAQPHRPERHTRACTHARTHAHAHLPVRPTTPQLVPAARWKLRLRNTGGSPGRYLAVTDT